MNRNPKRPAKKNGRGKSTFKRRLVAKKLDRGTQPYLHAKAKAASTTRAAQGSRNNNNNSNNNNNNNNNTQPNEDNKTNRIHRRIPKKSREPTNTQKRASSGSVNCWSASPQHHRVV